MCWRRQGGSGDYGGKVDSAGGEIMEIATTACCVHNYKMMSVLKWQPHQQEMKKWGVELTVKLTQFHARRKLLHHTTKG